MGKKIALYICECGVNISDNIDIDELIKFFESIEIGFVRTHKLLCSEEGKNFLSESILQEKPTHVIVVACSPREHELTFRKVCLQSGLNPYLFQMINIREQVAWATTDKSKATKKAKSYLKGAIKRILLHEPLEKREIDCSTDVVVIGAGVAGMESALLLAKAGRKVYLVERNSYIGGKVVGYEEVFPHMECAACMIEPKIYEVLHHENIELFTCSEVQEAFGFFGNFFIKIRKNARFVEKNKCFGCGACYEVCPVKVKNEADCNLSERKAIYIPFAGALPNVPVIDRKNCLRFKGQDCELCRKVCPFDAIDYEDKDELVEKKVGAVVIATGFDIFDVTAIPELGYGKIPEVYTSLEFERLLSTTGPTKGEILMKNSKQPKSITIVHCVGSRTEKYNKYCSGICCLYILKFVHLIKRKIPKIELFGIYTDLCLPGKYNQTFFDSMKKEIKLNQTSFSGSVEIKQHKEKIIVSYFDILRKRRKISTDMVILSPAIVPPKDTSKIAKIFSINQGKDGFLVESHTKLAPVSTAVEGIFIAGCVQGPKSIEDSITQGAGAAGKILSALVPGRKLELEPITAEVNDKLCGGCKICISICPFKGINWDEEKKVAVINEILCKGCGTCSSVCPSGAIRAKHFTRQQIFAEIEGVLR